MHLVRTTSLPLSNLLVLGVRKNLIAYSDYLSMVIVLSTGSTKKKPMTKKEREEKKRKHKEKQLKK